jgi:hypothetical protein
LRPGRELDRPSQGTGGAVLWHFDMEVTDFHPTYGMFLLMLDFCNTPSSAAQWFTKIDRVAQSPFLQAAAIRLLWSDFFELSTASWHGKASNGCEPQVVVEAPGTSCVALNSTIAQELHGLIVTLFTVLLRPVPTIVFGSIFLIN